MKQPCLIIIWTNGVIIFGIKIKINSSFAMGYVAGAIWIGIWQVEKYLMLAHIVGGVVGTNLEFIKIWSFKS